MAKMYADKLEDKNVFGREMVSIKDRWHFEELKDIRDAKEVSSKKSEIRQRLQRKHEMAMMKEKRITAMLSKLLKSNRNQEAIKQLLCLIYGFTHRPSTI